MYGRCHTRPREPSGSPCVPGRRRSQECLREETEEERWGKGEGGERGQMGRGDRAACLWPGRLSPGCDTHRHAPSALGRPALESQCPSWTWHLMSGFLVGGMSSSTSSSIATGSATGRIPSLPTPGCSYVQRGVVVPPQGPWGHFRPGRMGSLARPRRRHMGLPGEKHTRGGKASLTFHSRGRKEQQRQDLYAHTRQGGDISQGLEGPSRATRAVKGPLAEPQSC